MDSINLGFNGKSLVGLALTVGLIGWVVIELIIWLVSLLPIQIIFGN